MNRYLKTAIAAALPLLVAAGCNDFLKCSECENTPNNPTASTINQRLVAVQANLWEYMNGDLARLVAMWMQSMAGTDRQYAALGTYQITESGEDGEFQRAYTGGGLIDLRYIENGARANGDQVTVGVAQVIEAWMMGTTADIWGDIPYTQAANPDSFPTPEFDSQQDVYAHVQAVLDSAIANLASGAGTGPGAAELVYGGAPGKWTELAHTLKARFYLHTAEQDPSAYDKALAEAEQGISSNDNDYITLQTTTPNEDNNWYQFMKVQRSGYISGGKFMVDLLKGRSDPRLEDYYAPGDSTIGGVPQYLGAEPGEALESWMATLDTLRIASDYRQPLVTYNENLLIKAEVLAHRGDPTALDTLNKERAAWGDPTPWHTAVTLPAIVAPSNLLQEVMTEKYITLFQNIEVWNDYKRTCIPALVPAAGKSEIPARLLYGTTERQTNPNTPSNPSANWNDPNGC